MTCVLQAQSIPSAGDPPSILPWLLGALAVLAIGALAWHFLGA
jgi:hypothetical protein